MIDPKITKAQQSTTYDQHAPNELLVETTTLNPRSTSESVRRLEEIIPSLTLDETLKTYDFVMALKNRRQGI